MKSAKQRPDRQRGSIVPVIAQARSAILGGVRRHSRSTQADDSGWTAQAVFCATQEKREHRQDEGAQQPVPLALEPAHRPYTPW